MSHRYRTQLYALNLFIISTCFIWIYVESLLVTPERGNITYFNKKYIEKAFVNVRRYSRKSPYYCNVWGEIKEIMGNNVTVDIVFKEFLHNEYRRSFVEFHYKLCDLINKEPYIGSLAKDRDLSCPVPVGNFSVMNITGIGKTFPNVFPFKKGLVDFTLSIASTKEILAQFYFVLTFSS